MKPRFTVGKLTSGVYSDQDDWYVNDRAYGFQVVARFGGSGGDNEREARARAAELNQRHQAHLTELSDRERRIV
jgi:hypothetical protein